MNIKEYLEETCKKIDDRAEEGGCLGVYLTDDIKFMYHDDCFADFHDDFCILYDKVTEANMVIPYGKITMMQYLNDEIIKKQAEEIDIGKMLRKLMED